MPHNDSDPLTPVQQLLRLKRYEKPADDLVEDFVRRFQDRQRSELLTQSARALLLERVGTYWTHAATPRWAVGVAGVAAMLAMMWLVDVNGVPSETSGLVVRDLDGGLYPAAAGGNGFYTDAVMIQFSDDEEPSQDQGIYLSKHFPVGNANDAKTSMHASVYLDGSLSPTSVTNF